MTDTIAESATPGSFEFVIEREFPVPRDTMFALWTDCAHLKNWFGPKGFPMTHCSNDLRIGGMLHYCLKTPNGEEMWGRWIYCEIAPPARLEVISSFSDAQGGITRHPWSADWPLQTRSVTAFVERNSGTLVTVRWSVWEATSAEARAFEESADDMRQGWGGTFEQLEAYLGSLS